MKWNVLNVLGSRGRWCFCWRAARRCFLSHFLWYVFSLLLKFLNYLVWWSRKELWAVSSFSKTKSTPNTAYSTVNKQTHILFFDSLNVFLIFNQTVIFITITNKFMNYFQYFYFLFSFTFFNCLLCIMMHHECFIFVAWIPRFWGSIYFL